MADIFCIRIHICKKYFFPLLLFLKWKVSFGLHLPLDLINLFNIIILHVFDSSEQDHIPFEAGVPLIYRNNLLDLHDK